MKPILWKHGMGALLICLGVAACDQQRTGSEEAQAPYVAPEATTATPAQQPPADTTAQADPYATTPPVDASDSMTGSTDISGADVTDTETTGDTLGDRCAGLSGQALTDCLETESLRRQDTQDPTETPTEDVPQQ